ncbi:MAG: polysaccharide deacetylase family protein [Acidobacteria bacterium]|jgi:peptidoglycan/xylan/chitin deacetylase (PgdA/CDA1 family)|nr:polysaccharide deacetylase family protein [Acidobacteriota bacterium]
MSYKKTPELEKGIFTISLDFELIWGTVDLFGIDSFRQAVEVERNEVIDRLLDLFNEFNIPATWCTVGHLFLENCRLTDGRKHPEIVPPLHKWHEKDWFTHDPCSDEANAPLFYGKSLIEKILNNPVKQEIGSHSFSHIIFGDEGCSSENARTDIAECIKAAEKFNIKLNSFAFPRDEVGHLDVLSEFGFTCYRGAIPKWYEQGEGRSVVKRLAHFWDVITASTPPVVLPEQAENGLLNIPGSMIFFPMHGIRRYIPMSLRVKRACKGLDVAAEKKRIFHLWFHPTNMAFEIEQMFNGLRAILQHAAELRQDGVLEILSMSEIAELNFQ